MSELSNVIHHSVWPHFLEVHRRLKVSIELVDDALKPLLRSVGERSLSEDCRALDRIDQPLKEAVTRSLRSLQPEVVVCEGTPVVCAPIPGRPGNPIGAVLVASSISQTSDKNPGANLMRIATWLAGAVGKQLSASVRIDTSELDRFSSLYRLLKQAALSGSEREVVRSFVEALAVWQDAESWAYVRDLSGRYVLDLALPGSDKAQVPAVVEDERITAGLPLLQPSAADLEALGFRSDAILSRIGSPSSSEWLIVIGDSIDPSSEARIGVYSETVGQVLGEMTAVQSTRLTWAQVQHLLQGSDSPDVAVRGAIEELSTVVQGRACLIVSRLDGARVLTIGDAAELSSLPVPTRTGRALTLSIELPDPYRAVIGVVREGSTPLTRRDDVLVQSTAATLGTWLKAAASRLPIELERRTERRSFDQVIEQQADMVMAGGQPVSIIIISLGPNATHLNAAAQACVAHVRGLLRPNDMAGRLASGHIGVVLPDTPEDGAGVVAERVLELMSSHADFGSFPHASLASASRSPGAISASSLSLLLEAWIKIGAKNASNRSDRCGAILAH